MESMKDLLQCSANYSPLSPVSFLERAALVYGEKVSIIYGANIRFSWKQTHRRCLNLASALVQLGISPLDVVAAFAPNVPALYELHFGVPMAGAILSALNTRLDATTLAVILEKLEAKLLLVDYQFVDVVVKAVDKLSQRKCKLPILVLIPECDHQTRAPPWINLENLPYGSLNYDQLLSMGKADEFETIRPNNECDPISVNYTSGTTGDPKGAVYSHRAVYLNSLGRILNMEMRSMPVFIWTVDMFRCNGWCFPWTIAALGGTNVCLRTFSARVIFDSIALHRVTYICGKPTILNIIADASNTSEQVPSVPLQSSVEIIVDGALPASQILTRVMELGFNISHGYGMTEVLGPAIITPCKFPGKGLHSLMVEGVDVKDSNTMESVPNDGKSMGEIMFKGNTMMLGYLKDSSATEGAYKGGWYRTGDVGVRHPDGEVQMKDRAKDVIISNGEVISSVEVESVLLSNPKVLEAAVVGRNVVDDYLGNSSSTTPCAFVKLKEGCFASSKEIIEFCGENLPFHMVPHDVTFGDLPVNSTGKPLKECYEIEIMDSDEVETVLLSNPRVLEAAVVGRNVVDDCLGKSSSPRPCAFVKLKEGCLASSKEIIEFCGENLPFHMVPHDVTFGDLPVNSTGKVQKFVLRDKANVL